MEKESTRARLLERLQKGPPSKMSNDDGEKERRRLRQPLYVALAFDLIDDFFICISETNAIKKQKGRDHNCEEVGLFFHNFRLHVVLCLKHLIKLSSPPLTLANQQQKMKRGSKEEEEGETAGTLRQLLAALGGPRRQFLRSTSLRTVVTNGHHTRDEGVKNNDDSVEEEIGALHSLETRIATQQRITAAIRYSAVGEPSPLVSTTTRSTITAVRKRTAHLGSCQKTAATATEDENTAAAPSSASPPLRGVVVTSNNTPSSHNAVLLGALGLLHRPLNADFFLETLCGIYEEEQQGEGKEEEEKEETKEKEQQAVLLAREGSGGGGSTYKFSSSIFAPNPRQSVSAGKRQRQRRNTKACYVQEAMQLVAPRLFLGSFRPAKDSTLLERAHVRGICAVLNHPRNPNGNELHHTVNPPHSSTFHSSKSSHCDGLCGKGNRQTAAASDATTTTTATTAAPVVSQRVATHKTAFEEQNGPPKCASSAAVKIILRHSIAAEDNVDFSLLPFFDSAFDFIDGFVGGVGSAVGGSSSCSGEVPSIVGGGGGGEEFEAKTRNTMLDGSIDNNKGSVLVHCGAGISRSATIVAMYLLRRLNGFNTASMSSSTATTMTSARHEAGGDASSFTATAPSSVNLAAVSAAETPTQLVHEEMPPCSSGSGIAELNNSTGTSIKNNIVDGDVDRRQQHRHCHHNHSTLITVSEILSLMKYVRPMVNPNAGFRNQLKLWCTAQSQTKPLQDRK